MVRAHAFGAGKLNGSARAALRARVSDLVDDLEELREDAAKLADAVGNAAKAEVREAQSRVQDFRDDVEKRVRSRVREGERYVRGGVGSVRTSVREQPIQMLGVALGAGVVLGLLMSARR